MTEVCAVTVSHNLNLAMGGGILPIYLFMTLPAPVIQKQITNYFQSL